MKGSLSAALFLAVFALPRAVPAEDLTIVSTVTTPRGTTRTQTQYIGVSRMRVSDGERDTIVDLSSGKVKILDPRRKQYSETSLDELRAFLDQMDAAMAGRTVFDQTIGATASVTVAADAAGGRKVAGYDTEKHTLTMGESMRFEVWTAPLLQPPARYFDARKVVYATYGPLARRYDLVLDELKKIKGFPLATMSDSRMRVGRRQVTVEATEVRKGPVPESVFEVPADYTKIESPFGPGATPRPPRSPRPSP